MTRNMMSSLCLEVASQTPQEQKKGMRKLATLVKPGVSLIIHGIEGNCTGFYIVGDASFKVICVTLVLAVDAMRDAGIADISVEKMGDVPVSVLKTGVRVLSFMFLREVKCA